jgi:hypothetical protein
MSDRQFKLNTYGTRMKAMEASALPSFNAQAQIYANVNTALGARTHAYGDISGAR